MDTWWLTKVLQLQQERSPHVLISITRVEGSAPREVGTRMIITLDAQWGTIGGGNLEYSISKEARKLLYDQISGPVIHEVSLGASLGQCCGGRVQMLLEPVLPLNKVIVFGAGHVGKELIEIAQGLPLMITWVDERDDQFPEKQYSNVSCIIPDDSVQILEDLSGTEAVVILTHNHALDLSLCEGLLRRKHKSYIGLIGSRAKWGRFERQLMRRGFGADAVGSIKCPIGISGIQNKNPRAIAISIMAQLLQTFDLENHKFVKSD